MGMHCLHLRYIVLTFIEQVLRNISGPIDVGSRKTGAAVPPDAGYYEYDFLASKSRDPTKLPQLDDLQSSAASMLVNAGIAFWGSGDAQADNWDLVAGDVECDGATEPVDMAEESKEPPITVADTIPMEIKEEEGRNLSVTAEEDVVEMMLAVWVVVYILLVYRQKGLIALNLPVFQIHVWYGKSRVSDVSLCFALFTSTSPKVMTGSADSRGELSSFPAALERF
jgi:hypothetical protein